MTAAAVAISVSAAPPTRGRALVTLARAISWPLAVLGFSIGLALRALGLVPRLIFGAGHPDRGVRAGQGEISAFLAAAGRWLSFQSDRFPPPTGPVARADESPGPWHEARRRLCKSPIAVLAWIGVAIYAYVALGAQLGFIAANYAYADPNAVFVAPQGLGEAHPLGTNQIGRDVLALGLRGTLTAVWIGTVSALLACLLGTALGALSGYFGGWVDAAIVGFYTTLESIPDILLLLSFAYVLRKNPAFTGWYSTSFLNEHLHVSVGLFTLVLAIGLTSWVGVCRTVRGEFLRHRDRDYVVAAKALGVPTRRILSRHILPNVFHLVLVSFSLLFIGAIKAEVILSFLGIGLDAGEASWGQMIDHAKLELSRDPTIWWPLTTATVLMFGLVLSVNLFSDGLRDALDPRLKH